MVGTLCLSGAALVKAGANASSYFTTGATAEARIVPLINQVEGFVNSTTRYNWIDAFSALNVDVKYLLEEVVSDIVAMYMIQYDMSGFTSRSEAETMLDVLRDRAINGLKLLEDIKVKEFMTGA